jgi:hypothetical protein
MPKGRQSNGFTTDRGRLTIIGAGTSNGAQSFSPVLPGIEIQADWDEHRPLGVRMRKSHSSATFQEAIRRAPALGITRNLPTLRRRPGICISLVRAVLTDCLHKAELWPVFVLEISLLPVIERSIGDTLSEAPFRQQYFLQSTL